MVVYSGGLISVMKNIGKKPLKKFVQASVQEVVQAAAQAAAQESVPPAQAAMHTTLANLNDAQKKAVLFGSGPLLIVAGAGTGKTTVITRRIAHLISSGVKSDEILALTFTEKAAAEMEERVDILLPYGYHDLWISTFHAFCERILKQHALDIGVSNDFQLLDSVQQKILVRKNLEKFDLDYYRPLGNPSKFINELVKYFGKLKDEEIFPEEYLEYAQKIKLDKDNAEFDEGEAQRLNELANAYHVYQKLLLDNNALDFGDLINYALKLFRRRKKILEFYRAKFKYILVDEFQDTNFAQYELIKLLAAPKNNLNVVGDDDQSIYKFRGASISNIMQFKKDFPSAAEITLAENYRSTQDILDLAYKFIQQNNPERLEAQLGLSKKLISPLKGKGEIATLSAPTLADETEAVAKKIEQIHKETGADWNEFAVLVRANDQADAFISKFSAKGIPYTFFANKGLYKKAFIADLIAYMRLIIDHHDSANLYKVLCMEIFRINHDDLATILHFARKKTLSLYEALQVSETIGGIKKESAETIRTLLGMLSAHASLAAQKSATEVFVKAVHDLQIGNRLNEDTLENSQDRKLLEQFYRRMEKFTAENADKSLKAYLDNLDLEEDAGEEGKIDFDPNQGPESVKILTVHSSKGLEFSYVFIVNLVKQRFPSMNRKDSIEIPAPLLKEALPEGDVHLQEERRLFYVAMTRAKRGLYFTYALDYGGARTKPPSQFLIELGLVKEPQKSVEILRKEQSIARHYNYDPHVFMPNAFSYTQISDFKRCPMSFKYKYLIHIPVEGSANQSFGITIHKTLEDFLKRYKAGLEMTQLELFGTARGKNDGAESAARKLASEELAARKPVNAESGDKVASKISVEGELFKIYEKNWIDEWYETKKQKEEFRERGKKILKSFYEEFVQNPVAPKYIEEKFNLKLGEYFFSGKIDRADAEAQGLDIVDYKTGAKKEETKEGRRQLMIYQWAAQEFLKEKVVGLKYWYLFDNVFSESFVASSEDIAELKAGLLEDIEEIRRAVAQNSFKALDAKIKHDCKFENLE